MAGRLSPRDLRDVTDASSYAVAREEEMAIQINQVEDMGTFRLWWDSKVPENNKWFLNKVSWKKSDPDVIKTEIAKHRDFYANMKAAIAQVRNGDEDSEELIEELYEKLSQLQLESESKIGSTDSDALYRLHREFVQKHQLLENKIKRIEVVAVRQQLRRTRDDWREAVTELREVREEIRGAMTTNRDLTDRFERLMTVNEQMVVQQEDLRQENTLIRTLLGDLVRGTPRP